MASCSVGFGRLDGGLTCDGVSVEAIRDKIGRDSPFFLYSQSQLDANVLAYHSALDSLSMPGGAIIGYSIKANNNLSVLRRLGSQGTGAVVVSGNELRTARLCGIPSDKIVYNGNGKTKAEITFAVSEGVLLSVDSQFDLANITACAKASGAAARVMIRINPDIDPKVHPYISTGIMSSKFGIEKNLVDEYISAIQAAGPDVVSLEGLHCHLGSTISDTKIFQDATDAMLRYVDHVEAAVGAPLKVLDIGGGLGIDYYRGTKGDVSMPTPMDLIDSIRSKLQGRQFTFMLEPGRSLVANTGIFVAPVTGTKSNGAKHFVVVDGSMTEVIRPSLYDAYHHIEYTAAGVEPAAEAEEEKKVFDVVGPVCESADFLGKDRLLAVPHTGQAVAVFDVGAYCYTMASNYNMRVRPGEYMTSAGGSQLCTIRKPEEFSDLIRMCIAADEIDPINIA